MAYPPTTTTRLVSLTEAQYNADISGLASAMQPANIDDYTASVAEMQIQTNPGDIGTESLATSLSEELERIRFQLAAITGGTYWYEPPAISLAGVTATFAAGTEMIFRQSSAPTGWTKETDADFNNAAMRCVTGSISDPTSVNPSRSNMSTVMDQTAVGNKTITTTLMPSHTHTVPTGTNVNTGNVMKSGSSGAGTVASNATGGGGTHSHTITMDMKYVDVIIASKD